MFYVPVDLRIHREVFVVLVDVFVPVDLQIHRGFNSGSVTRADRKSAVCSILTQALPSTTLAEHCYDGMFNTCSKLTKAFRISPRIYLIR